MNKKIICIFPKIGNESNIQQLLLREILQDDFKIVEGSWKSMLLCKYNVILVNWPELFLFGRFRTAKTLLFLGLVMKWKVRKTTLITIIHNPEGRKVARDTFVTKIILRKSHGKIHLNSVHKLQNKSDIIIPNFSFSSTLMSTKYVKHEDKFDGIAFGFLSKYKNLENTIDAFKIDGKLNLLIVGKAESIEYSKYLSDYISNSNNIQILEGFMDFPNLISRIMSSRMGIFLYNDIFNSAAVMLTLSCGKPVVVTECEYAVELLQEVGSKWVYIVKKESNSEYVRHVLQKVLNEENDRIGITPNFSPIRELEANKRLYCDYINRLVVEN